MKHARVLPLTHIPGLAQQPALWFVLGAIVLAIHPLLWLLNTWTDPAYNSNGVWVFTIVLALFAWSYNSPRLYQQKNVKALTLLGMSSLIRLLGQLLAINSLAALTLVIDIYAIALLCGLQYRKNAISPVWLAALFALSLPLERILQRSVGYGLQQISASGACEALGWFNDQLSCQGVRIILAGQDVLVDLPCSGARGLLLLLAAFMVTAAVKRPNLQQSIIGAGICLAAAIVSNSIRITLLATGIAYPNWMGGINVMSSPWHDITGLITLTVALLPILWWMQKLVRPVTYAPFSSTTSAFPKLNHRTSLTLGMAFASTAMLILQVPGKPVDVAHLSNTPILPGHILGVAGKDDPLSDQERNYFRRYGGGASRKVYNDRALLVVQTSAPLRHLHAPDECLRGSGHKVQYLGMIHNSIPTAVYRSIDPLGQAWRIRVSFVSDDGQQFHSVAAAVWHWMQNPASTWSQVQRITPWSSSDSRADQFDEAVLRALDIKIQNTFKPTKA